MPQKHSSFLDEIKGVATPPFKGMSLFFFLWYLGSAFLGNWAQNPLHTGDLADSDDYLYLVQAIDWLKGQNWLDLMQHRMNPPDGTYIHYSHILSSFYGVLIYILHVFFNYQTAAIIVSVFIPPIYFALLLLCIRWLANNLTEHEWNDTPAFFLILCQPFMFCFTLGHIDHHGLEALLAIVSFCGMTMMIMHTPSYAWAAVTGLVLAFSLLIGLEALPFVSVMCSGIVAWSIIEGGRASRSGSIFGLSFFLSCAVFLPVTRPWPQIFEPEVAVYSIVYVAFACGVALSFAAILAADKIPSQYSRYLAGGVSAVLSALLFFYFFPQLKAGPYGGVDPMVAKMIYTLGDEAWPIIGHGPLVVKQIQPVLAELSLAAFAALFMTIQTLRNPQRYIWGMALAVILMVGALTTFYQCRLLYYVQVIAAVALAGMLWHDWKHRPKKKSGSKYVFWVIRVVAVISVPLLVCLILQFPPKDSLLVIERQAYDSELSENETKERLCDTHRLAKILNDKKTYGSHPHIIINAIDEGTDILFRTPHMVLAAPYHMNTTGNLDAFSFFMATNPDVAKAIATQRDADFVTFCDDKTNRRIYDYLKADAGAAEGTTFIEQLTNNQIPAWLKPVNDPALGHMHLYEIVRSAQE